MAFVDIGTEKGPKHTRIDWGALGLGAVALTLVTGLSYFSGLTDLVWEKL